MRERERREREKHRGRLLLEDSPRLVHVCELRAHVYMCICVCACVYMYVYVYVNLYVYLYVLKYVYVYVYVHVHAYAYMYVRMYIYMHTCMCTSESLVSDESARVRNFDTNQGYAAERRCKSINMSVQLYNYKNKVYTGECTYVSTCINV